MRIITLLFFCIVSLASFSQKDLRLWYKQPAAVWTEALPVGNGRVGAMVFGGVEKELLQLNEATLWSGGPARTNVNPESPNYLPQAREALFKGDYDKANELVKKMQGLYSQSYMPLGDLQIEQDLKGATAANYYRDLDLATATATTTYTIANVHFRREVFVSAPDQLLVVRLAASQPGQLNLKVSMKSLLPSSVEVIGSNAVMLKGKAPAQADPNYFNVNKKPVIYMDSTGCRGMRFAAPVKAIVKNGTTRVDTSGIVISNASEVFLLISAATSFNGYDKCPDKQGKNEIAIARSYLDKAATKAYSILYKSHLSDFRHFFNRVSIDLNNDKGSRADLPMDERIETYNKGADDPGLEALYFQYGRYLLISSSRTPAVPANLQGIWNNHLRAPWSSNYTTNINVQMNYWPAEAANLSELHEPLFGLIRNMSVTGRKTAKEYYNAGGWVAHHNSDIWAMSNAVGDVGKGDPKWANWAMGANWLTRHLWEHYLYTGDKDFLRKTAYPIMKGAAQFTLQWLVPDSSGRLVTAPSTSPENDYYYDGKKSTALSIATTMDMGIIRDLFGNIVEATHVLNTDATFRDSILAATSRLYPFMIGSKGQLQEWYKDFEDVDPHHRHVSHLYALHPASLVSPVTTPDLAEAARRTLELRGDEGTGWSLAWKVNFWARLLDGDRAYRLYRNLMRLTKENNTNYNRGGGAYPNLFDAHPPFQIDGNFAGAAGLMEMLLQSQHKEIYLLPALPSAWQQGAVKGLVARGGFEVNLNWHEGKLLNAEIHSRIGGVCTIRTNEPVVVKGMNARSEKSSIGYLLSFKTVKGKRYSLVLATE